MFKIGDVVQMKCGGPEMVVTRTGMKLPPPYPETDETEGILCTWINKDASSVWVNVFPWFVLNKSDEMKIS